MSLVVQKFGGTSVADTERIRNVAQRVAKTYDQGNNVVVILSAMAGITDNLITMAQDVTEQPEVMQAAEEAGKLLGQRLRQGHDRMQVTQKMQTVMMEKFKGAV